MVCINFVISLSVKLNYSPCFDRHLLMNINLFIANTFPWNQRQGATQKDQIKSHTCPPKPS